VGGEWCILSDLFFLILILLLIPILLVSKQSLHTQYVHLCIDLSDEGGMVSSCGRLQSPGIVINPSLMIPGS
jgi:hypothetical protein